MLDPAYINLASVNEPYSPAFGGDFSTGLSFPLPVSNADLSLGALPSGATASHLYLYGKMGPQAASQGDLDNFTDRVVVGGLPGALAERQQTLGAMPQDALTRFAPSAPPFIDMPVDLSLGITQPVEGGTTTVASSTAGPTATETTPVLDDPSDLGKDATDRDAINTEGLSKPAISLSPHDMDHAAFLHHLANPPAEAKQLPLENPSLVQLGIALAAGLLRPRYGLQAATLPFQVQLQRRAQAQAIADRQAEEARQAYQRQLTYDRALLEDDRESEKDDKPKKGTAKPKDKTSNARLQTPPDQSSPTKAKTPSTGGGSPPDTDDNDDDDDKGSDPTSPGLNTSKGSNRKLKPPPRRPRIKPNA